MDSTPYPVPAEPPTYTSRPPVHSVTRRRLYALLDSVFAGYGLILTFWFALVLLLSGLDLTWRSVIFLVAFWALLAYVALPRLHQTFTTLYIPDYFMARTKTADGLLGDPVNLAVLGSEEDVHAAMRRAHWVQADEITVRSSLGIIKSSLTRRSYPAAPVSSLFLFGRQQDFAYQQEVDGNASQRHHVRFWRTPGGWHLPGGHRVDWLAAGTYDRSVGLSSMTLQVTHKIDADIDAERDYIISTVRYEDPQTDVAVIEDFSPAFHDRNGGGDAVMTDGTMPVLDLTGAATRAASAEVDLRQVDDLDLPTDNEFLAHAIPPKAFSIVGLILLVDVVRAILAMATVTAWTTTAGGLTDQASSAVGQTVGVVVLIALFLLTLRRRRWPRLVFLLLAAVAATAGLAVISTGADTGAASYLGTGVSLLLVLVFSSPAVRQWVFTLRRRGAGSPMGH